MKSRILVLQPDDINYAILNRYLSDLGYPDENIIRCTSLIGTLSVPQNEIDIILADLSRITRGIIPALLEIKRQFTDTPVIVFSDNKDTDTYVEIIRAGGQYLLVNGSFDAGQLQKGITITLERNMQLTNARNTAMEYERHFNNGPIPMWIIDQNTMRFLTVNDAAVDKYGYSREEFSKMSIMDIRPEEDIPATLENYYARETEHYDAGYWRHLRKNGEVFYVHIYSHATQFGNHPARLCYAVNVNAKLRSDQRNRELNSLVKEQKEQLDGILSSISDAIWSRTADNLELVYANNAYYQLYGYIPGKMEPEKKLITDSVYPADRGLFFNAIKEVKTKGKTKFVYRYINKDGSLKTFKVSAVYKKGSNGKPDTIDGITIDITREKELYDALRNSEHKLLTTINNTKDLIWSVNKELKIIFCNKAYQDFFYKNAGIKLDEGDYVLGDWHSGDFIERRKREYKRGLEGESFTTVIEEALGGGLRYYEINSSPIIDIDDNIIGVNCVSRDITQQINQLNKIQQQNELLKEIAAIQFHKVRGPVASILGLLSLIDYENECNENNKEILDKMKIATNDLDVVIKEIVSKTKEITN